VFDSADIWRTAAVTGVSYALLIAVVFVVLFVLPFLAFRAVG